MKREFSNDQELVQYFNINRTAYKNKAVAFMDDIVQLNQNMSHDDLSTIVSPKFYDDIHDNSLELGELLDNHFMSHLEEHKRESFIALHDFYNR